MRIRDSRSAETAGNYRPRGRCAVGKERAGTNLMESERAEMGPVRVLDDGGGFVSQLIKML